MERKFLAQAEAPGLPCGDGGQLVFSRWNVLKAGCIRAGGACLQETIDPKRLGVFASDGDSSLTPPQPTPHQMPQHPKNEAFGHSRYLLSNRLQKFKRDNTDPS